MARGPVLCRQRKKLVRIETELNGGDDCESLKQMQCLAEVARGRGQASAFAQSGNEGGGV